MTMKHMQKHTKYNVGSTTNLVQTISRSNYAV